MVTVVLVGVIVLVVVGLLIRAGVAKWRAARQERLNEQDPAKVEAAQAMSAAGLAAGPCLADEEVVSDPHVAARGMLVEIERTDGVAQPVLTPGNPVRMSAVAAPPATWLSGFRCAASTPATPR